MLIDRAEIWSDLKAATGTHQANIPRDDVWAAFLSEDLNGVVQLELHINRDSIAWPQISERRVIRSIFDDASIGEFRILKPREERQRSTKIARVYASGIRLDLRNGVISRTEADGTVTLFYSLLAQTRDDLVDLILAKAPTYFAKGTIDGATTKVPSFTFNFDTPLCALRELAELEGLELNVRRNGDTNYLVDLVTQIGSSAAVPEFRFRKNILGVARTPDASDLTNRIYPAGASDGAVRLSIGKARWRVTAVPFGNQFDVDGSPIYVDDHLEGDYIETPTGSKIQITVTDAANQRITTASAHGLSVGDYVRFRDDAAGKELVYVEDPDSQTSYGVIAGAIEEDDIPPVDNLVSNPSLSDWTGGMPDDFSAVGSPTISEETQEEYTKIGGSSAKVIATAAGEGLKTAAISISPADPHIYYSGHINVYVDSGAVEFYWQHSTEGRFPEEGSEEAAYTSETDRFVEGLLIQGKEFPTGTVELYIVSKGGAATFYVDAVQFTNTAANYPYYDGIAAQDLWRRGLDELDRKATPLVKYDLDVMDLTSIDPDTWPYDDLTLGGDCYIYDEELGVETTVRVLRLRRDLLKGHPLSLTLSNKPDDIIDALTLQARRRRLEAEPRPSVARVKSFVHTVKRDGTIEIAVVGAGAARSFRYEASTQTMPTYASVVSSGEISDNIDGTPLVVQDGGSDFTLGRGQTAFIRIVVFALKNGVGVGGETVTAKVGPPPFSDATITSQVLTQIGNGSSGDAKIKSVYTTPTETGGVRIYRRRTTSSGNWPTKTGASDGPLDPKFDRGIVGPLDNWTYQAGAYSTGDYVNEIGVPVDLTGTEYPGNRQTDELQIIATGGSDPYFDDAETYVVETQPGTSCTAGQRRELRIYWGIINCQSSDVVTIEVQIDGGPGWDLLWTSSSSPCSGGTEQWNYTTGPWYYYAGGPCGTMDFRIRVKRSGVTKDEKILNEPRGCFEHFPVHCS